MGVHAKDGLRTVADAGGDDVHRDAVRQRERGVRMSQDVQCPRSLKSDVDYFGD